MSNAGASGPLWAIGTTRNEVDLVRVNVCHHLSQGVDRFLLIDNDSRDGTRDQLADLARAFPVEWRPYSGTFLQDELLTGLAREAAARGAAWVVPVDADEFWYAPGTTLRALLDRQTAGALRVQPVNFIQRRAQRVTTPLVLASMTRTVEVPVGPLAQTEELVDEERIAYVEQLYHYKWIARATPELRFGWGSHTVDGITGERGFAPGIECLHAPLRSLSVLEQKLDTARVPDQIEAYFRMAWHLRRWRRMAWEGRLEEEWRANSYDSDGRLDVFGATHPVVPDYRLCNLLQRWM